MSDHLYGARLGALRTNCFVTAHASHAVMVLLYQCFIYTHFFRVHDGKVAVHGLSREKKMHEDTVSKTYLM